MSDYGVSKAHLLIGHLVSGFIVLCSAVISRPLYFGYFVFFLPYVVKLLSLLYPLFATSLLVLIAFVIGVVDVNCAGDRLAEGGVGYLLIAYASIVDRLRPEGNCDRNEEFQCVEDFGMFEVLFGSSVTSEVGENRVEVVDENPVEPPLQASACSEQGNPGIGESEGGKGNKDKIDSIPHPQLENSGAGMDERRLENFLKILDQFERMTSNVEEKKNVKPLRGTNANKVIEKQRVGSLVRNGSEAAVDKANVASAVAAKVGVTNPNEENQDTSMVKISSSVGKPNEEKQDASMVKVSSTVDNKCEDGRESIPKFDSADDGYEDYKGENATKLLSFRSFDDRYDLGSYGSMRKEKEWKRTLACKLFEERHNVGGVEGMDSLWEAYEMDANKPGNPKINKKKSRVKREVEEEEEEEEEEDQVRQLCCLQALKLSTGKMNLGMGRPNLVKITKAIKGFGWLHHVSSKHSKKVHNNGDNRY